MISFILQEQNLPFAVSLGLFSIIGFTEIISTLFGAALSGIIDSFSPSIDLDSNIDSNISMDLGSSGVLKPFIIFIRWLNAEGLPLLVVIIIILFSFGTIGIGIQSMAIKNLGYLFSSFTASMITIIPSLIITRYFGKLIANILPTEETEAVSEQSFIGREAIMVGGTATLGNPAQAKLKDSFNTTHYLMVEPEKEGFKLRTGDKIIITEKNNAIYKAVLTDILT